MKYHLLGCFAAIFALSACGGAKAPEADSPENSGPGAAEQLAALVEEYFERDLEMNPLNATQMGDDRFDDRIANFFGPQYIAATEAMDEQNRLAP